MTRKTNKTNATANTPHPRTLLVAMIADHDAYERKVGHLAHTATYDQLAARAAAHGYRFDTLWSTLRPHTLARLVVDLDTGNRPALTALDPAVRAAEQLRVFRALLGQEIAAEGDAAGNPNPTPPSDDATTAVTATVAPAAAPAISPAAAQLAAWRAERAYRRAEADLLFDLDVAWGALGKPLDTATDTPRETSAPRRPAGS